MNASNECPTGLGIQDENKMESKKLEMPVPENDERRHYMLVVQASSRWHYYDMRESSQ
jgi:hypothetical protein|tara:strand:- start:1059 stop:1232 length:174 start_codon:yes stop_codon:yes gene_type:complete